MLNLDNEEARQQYKEAKAEAERVVKRLKMMSGCALWKRWRRTQPVTNDNSGNV